MAEENKKIPLNIPLKDGSTLTIYVTARGPDNKGNIVSFHELAANPETSQLAARVIADGMKEQIDLSPAEVATGWLNSIASGAWLDAAEEVGSSIQALPALTGGWDEYTDRAQQLRDEFRTSQGLFQIAHPEQANWARSIGFTVPMGLSILSDLIATRGGASRASLSRAATMRAANPYLMATEGFFPNTIEAALKMSALAGTESVMTNEGYLRDRIEELPSALREGAEWGVILNFLLHGGVRSISGINNRVKKVKDWYAASRDEARIADIEGQRVRLPYPPTEGGTTTPEVSPSRDVALDLVNTTLASDALRGRPTTGASPAIISDATTGTGTVHGQAPFMLGEFGGPRTQVLQKQSVKDDVHSGQDVIDMLRERTNLENVRRDAALPQTNAVDDVLASREGRLTGRVEGDVVERPGVLGSDPLPPGVGVADIYYYNAYQHPDAPLSGGSGGLGFKNFFGVWKGWNDVWKNAVNLRELRITDKKSQTHTEDGLSNQLPDDFNQFLSGIRLVPKTTHKRHGTKVGVGAEARVVHEKYDIVQQHFNPKTEKWVDVAAGRSPNPKWESRQKSSNGDWVIRLKPEHNTISYETLHDMRKGLQAKINAAEAKNTGETPELNAIYRQLNERIHPNNPDFAKADRYHHQYQKMVTASGVGTSAVESSLIPLERSVAKMGGDEMRAYKAALVQQIQKLGLSPEDLIKPTGKRIRDKLRTMFPAGRTGDDLFNQMIKELSDSAKMAETAKEIKPASIKEQADAAMQNKRGWGKTLALLAKVPAYKFSLPFALGRDIVEQAGRIEKLASVATARELNDILSRLSGPPAERQLAELASRKARVEGNDIEANAIMDLVQSLKKASVRYGALQHTFMGEKQERQNYPLDTSDPNAASLKSLMPQQQRVYPASDAIKGGSSMLMDAGAKYIFNPLKRRIFSGPE